MALEEDIQALQKQLEETELECVYTKAQIATLARLSDRTAAAAALPVHSGLAAEPDAWHRDTPQPQPAPQETEAAASSAVRAHKQRRLPKYTRCTPSTSHQCWHGDSRRVPC